MGSSRLVPTVFEVAKVRSAVPSPVHERALLGPSLTGSVGASKTRFLVGVVVTGGEGGGRLVGVAAGNVTTRGEVVSTISLVAAPGALKILARFGGMANGRYL